MQQSVSPRPAHSSIMKAKIFLVLKIAIPIVFWLTAWELAALAIDHLALMPHILETLIALGKLIISPSSYLIILGTLERVLLSVIFGVVYGILLAVAAAKVEPIRIILAPFISVMKSTPVAVISLLLYLLLPGKIAPIVVSFLMIMPVIWQNLIDGFDSIDKNLSEVCTSFEFPFVKRFRILIFPALMKYLIPALITSVGLAWKAVVSAEILVHTTASIGEMIFQSKYEFKMDYVFAWTLVVIFMSIAFEKLTKLIARRFK